MRQIRIFDTTLRDGEQCPGASMNAREKLEVAHQLARLKVDVIEAGFPFSSPGDFESVRQIAREVHGPIICGLARAKEDDINATGEAVRDAARPRIHTFIATSDIHLQHKLRKTRDEVLEMAVAAVKCAKSHVEDVEFSPEDATRSDREFLCRVVEAAIKAGATTINIPDTVGYTTPGEYQEMLRELLTRVPGMDKAILSVHCHDDLGLAVANSLAAVEVGAGQIECTINGIGERAGNTSLEEVVMAIHTRGDRLQAMTGVETKEIYKASRLVSLTTGFPVPPNKAIVGSNAFAHAAGIHQDGMLKHASTYEIMTPETIGLDSNRLVLTSRSGRHAFRVRMETLGYQLSTEDLDRAYTRFLEIADKKKEVFDADLEAMMSDQIHVAPEDYLLEFMTVATSTTNVPGMPGMHTATLRIRRGEESKIEAATGVGAVDAIYNAIKQMIPVEHRLDDYVVSAVTGGTDAFGEVMVKLATEHNVYTGRGSALDILEASAKAYLQAINKLVYYTSHRAEDKRIVARV
jgi:2-isopropylmalate synthase